jgi:uncharacterized protein (TIGR03437 family)
MRFFKLTCVSSIFVGCALAQPQVSSNGVLNGGSFVVGQAVAPGSVVSIFGGGLAASTLVGDTIPLSASLGATTVFFNGEQAPLYFVSPGQINAQLPWDLLSNGANSGTVNVTVANGATTSAPMSVQLAALAPGIYSIPAGAGYAVAINNSDGSIAAPVGAIPGILTHPASAGDVMIMYANGLGPVGVPNSSGGLTPSTPALGAASLDATRYTLANPTLLIGGTQAQLLFSGLAPQFVGISQVNFVVPTVTPGNSIPIQLVEGGITTTDQVVIAIQ